MKIYYQDAAVTLYHGDCREILARLESDAVDAVVADPPYNVGKDYGVHDDNMAPGEYRSWLTAVLALCARVSRDGVVFFPGTRNVLEVPIVLASTPLRFVRMLGWHKKEYAGDKWTGDPAMCWEPIIWASVLPAHAYYNRIYGMAGRDFLVVPSTHGDPFAAVHPCPKPGSVMSWLIGLFVPEGGTVLDPTAGTGTTLWAAKESRRRAIGIEIEERYCEIAAKRCAQEVLSL